LCTKHLPTLSTGHEVNTEEEKKGYVVFKRNILGQAGKKVCGDGTRRYSVLSHLFLQQVNVQKFKYDVKSLSSYKAISSNMQHTNIFAKNN
jgi:hypothetical protein